MAPPSNLRAILLSQAMKRASKGKLPKRPPCTSLSHQTTPLLSRLNPKSKWAKIQNSILNNLKFRRRKKASQIQRSTILKETVIILKVRAIKTLSLEQSKSEKTLSCLIQVRPLWLQSTLIMRNSLSNTVIWTSGFFLSCL